MTDGATRDCLEWQNGKECGEGFDGHWIGLRLCGGKSMLDGPQQSIHLSKNKRIRVELG